MKIFRCLYLFEFFELSVQPTCEKKWRAGETLKKQGFLWNLTQRGGTLWWFDLITQDSKMIRYLCLHSYPEAAAVLLQHNPHRVDNNSYYNALTCFLLWVYILTNMNSYTTHWRLFLCVVQPNPTSSNCYHCLYGQFWDMTTVKLLLQRRGVGWGGDGLFNSYTSRDSLYDISAPQAKFFWVFCTSSLPETWFLTWFLEGLK